MPAKRRASTRKAAAKPQEEAPKIEETVEEVVPEVTEEQVEVAEDEETVAENDDQEDDNDQDDDNESPEAKETKTIEEKIQDLDKLSKAHPVGLLMSLCKQQNKLRPSYAVTKAEKVEGQEPTQTCIARYGELMITIPGIPSDNIKFAKKVAADLILSELYWAVGASSFSTIFF